MRCMLNIWLISIISFEVQMEKSETLLAFPLMFQQKNSP
jgi:hypothetical protein